MLCIHARIIVPSDMVLQRTPRQPDATAELGVVEAVGALQRQLAARAVGEKGTAFGRQDQEAQKRVVSVLPEARSHSACIDV